MSHSDQRLLIVDDERVELMIIEDYLQNRGWTNLTLLQSPEDALSLIESGEPVAALLMDIYMPDFDGPLFLRQLAKISFTAPIILVSGIDSALMNNIVELGRFHGLQIAGLIQKPVQKDNLVELLQNCLKSGERSALQNSSAAHDTLNLSEQSLRKALTRGEIHPWYQPKVEIGRMRLVGAEALARWSLADGKIISPGTFLGAIQAYGLADELFHVMLEQVMQDMTAWRIAGRPLKVSVNLPMDSTQNPDLPDKVQLCAAKHGIAHEQLSFEVTESQLPANHSLSLDTLTRLSLLGFKLSIDDFGTGCADFSHLAALPFTELKVDGRFVRDADNDNQAASILQTAVTFAGSLGMEVVAEGVETFDQVDLLRDLGVTVIQGFLISQPMPALKFNHWLADWRAGAVNWPSRKRPLTIMVVDDSKIERQFIGNILKRLIPDAILTFASDATEAMAMASIHNPDCIALDYLMPGLNGLDLIRHLRDVLPTGKFVLLTGELSESLAANCSRLGALYCQKPLTVHQSERLANFFLTQ